MSYHHDEHPVPPVRHGYQPVITGIMPSRRPLAAGEVVEVAGRRGRLVDLLSSPYAPGPDQLWRIDWSESEPAPADRVTALWASAWVRVSDRVA